MGIRSELCILCFGVFFDLCMTFVHTKSRLRWFWIGQYRFVFPSNTGVLDFKLKNSSDFNIFLAAPHSPGSQALLPGASQSGGRAEQSWAEQRRGEERTGEQSKAEQSRATHLKASEASRTEQSRTKQSRASLKRPECKSKPLKPRVVHIDNTFIKFVQKWAKSLIDWQLENFV